MPWYLEAEELNSVQTKSKSIQLSEIISVFNIIVLHRPLPHKVPGSVVLSNLSTTTREVYNTIETADHDYEMLDKYSPATYDDMKIPPQAKPQPEAESVQLQPLVSTGDHGFTQCPAYIPVATTSIHGNTAEHIYN